MRTLRVATSKLTALSLFLITLIRIVQHAATTQTLLGCRWGAFMVLSKHRRYTGIRSSQGGKCTDCYSLAIWPDLDRYMSETPFELSISIHLLRRDYKKLRGTQILRFSKTFLPKRTQRYSNKSRTRYSGDELVYDSSLQIPLKKSCLCSWMGDITLHTLIVWESGFTIATHRPRHIRSI